MNKWISLLSGLLIAQLVLAITINLSGEDYGAFQAEEKLLAFQSDQVDGLRIEGDGRSLLLKKQGNRWLLPESGNFPADQAGVERLLEKLAGLEKGWPLATSSGAAKRFKVAEDDYQAKLALLADNQSLAELYIGTSPGFRKVHVRPDGEDAVYGVAFNSWEASAKLDDWIDKQILKLDERAVQRIEMPDYVLQKDGEALTLADLSDQEQLNGSEVDTLLHNLADLRIQSILGKEAKPEYRQDEPELEVKVTRKDAELLTYRFSKPEEESYYILKRSDLDDYFKLPEYSVKPILETTRDKLVQAQASEVSDDQVDTAEVLEAIVDSEE